MPFTRKLNDSHWKLKAFILLCTILSCAEPKVTKVTKADWSQQTNVADVQVNVTSYWDHLEFTLSDNENYEIVTVNCSILNGKTQYVNGSCTSLWPCSKYKATIEIKDLQTQEVFQQVIDDTETSYIEPQVSISDITPTTKAITLKWRAENSTCISKFDIDILVNSTLVKSTLVSEVQEQNEQLIDGLDPCQDYNIQLKTHLKKEESNVQLMEKKTKTEYAEPGSVEVVFSPTDKNSQMKVTWPVPEHQTCIKDYQIEWRTKDCSAENMKAYPSNCHFEDNISDPNVTEYIITNLQGCEDYIFVLSVNNKETQIAESTFESLEQVPEAVLLQSVGSNDTSIKVHWNPPTNHTKCIKNYVASLLGPMQHNPQEALKQAVTNTEITFENLQPCGEYILYIIPILQSDNEGTGREEQFILKEKQPTAVPEIEVKTAPHSMQITWQPPEFAQLCLEKYRISMWEVGNEEEIASHQTTQNEIEIDGLAACQIYGIQIIPVTSEKTDGISAQAYAETDPIKPKTPQYFECIGNYSSALEFNASVVEPDNNCKIMWAKFQCKVADLDADEAQYKIAEQYVESEHNHFSAILSPLSPFTTYTCNVKVLNIAGWSGVAEQQLNTAPYFPASPEDVALVDSTIDAIAVSFNPPRAVFGDLNFYLIHFEPAKYDYYRPSKCENIKKNAIQRTSPSLVHTFHDLLPYTNYSIQVAASNQFGISEYTRPYMLKTQPWVSEPILELDYNLEGPYKPYDNYSAKITLKWAAPCQSNGEIEYMKLRFKEISQKNTAINAFTIELPPKFDKYGYMIYNETNLRPQSKYNVTITVKVKDVDKLSQKKNTIFTSPAGVPRNFNEQSLTEVQVSVLAAKHPATSAVVRFPVDILKTDVGDVKYVALLLSEKGCNKAPKFHYNAIDSFNEWPQVSTWHEVNNGEAKNCISQYQATPKQWDPNVDTQERSVRSFHGFKRGAVFVEYTLGTDDCENFKPSEDLQYCNGPLKADTDYYLVIRLFTANGYSDATMLEFKTDTIVQLKYIIIGICTCFVLIVIAGAIYTWIARRYNWHRSAVHAQSVEESVGDMLAKHYAANYHELTRAEKITCEFRELSGINLEMSYYPSEFDRPKNRYADIFPYVRNRVILAMDDEGSDYINASFIDGYRRPKEYIATQGPKAESVDDFWRMILQYNVQIIVMVTQFKEGNVLKCHKYYPYESPEMHVKIEKKETFDIYDRTEMLLTNSKETKGIRRKIVHFFYKKWPDHGCPTDPMQLITFVRKVKAEKIPSNSPILVHCSAGVGRTGTFIALDIIMQRLKQESRINIFGTVKKLRLQRMKMVQTQAQYTFLYACGYELCRKRRRKFADFKILQKSDVNKNSIMEKQTELFEKVAGVNEPPYRKSECSTDSVSVANTSSESSM